MVEIGDASPEDGVLEKRRGDGMEYALRSSSRQRRQLKLGTSLDMLMI